MQDTRKRMEAFLLGDKGPEVFYEVQETVVDTIQEKYYSSFLLSDQYKALIIELAKEEANKGMSIKLLSSINYYFSDKNNPISLLKLCRFFSEKQRFK